MVPYAKVLGFLINANNPGTVEYIGSLSQDARLTGVMIQAVQASSAERGLEPAFEALRRAPVDALVIMPDTLFLDRQDQLVALVKREFAPRDPLVTRVCGRWRAHELRHRAG